MLWSLSRSPLYSLLFFFSLREFSPKILLIHFRICILHGQGAELDQQVCKKWKTEFDFCTAQLEFAVKTDIPIWPGLRDNMRVVRKKSWLFYSLRHPKTDKNVSTSLFSNELSMTTVYCHSSADNKQLPKTFPEHWKSFPCSLVSLYFHSTLKAGTVGPVYLIMCIWGWG